MTNKQKRHAIKTAHARVQFKLKMERPFTRELKSFFFKQSKNVAQGNQLDSISYCLDIQYNRIVRNMTGIKIKDDDKDDYGLERAIILLLTGRAIKQAITIDKTTEKLMRRAKEMAREELAEDGVLFPSNDTLNKTAAGIFKSLNRSRPLGIAVTETQMLTEQVQEKKADAGSDMMSDAIANNDKELGKRAAAEMDSLTATETAEQIGKKPAGELFAVMAVLKKTWVTMGDAKVRAWHKAANFQTVPVNEPFIVDGESLMRPGDTSMGASMRNIARCRCSSVLM
jgi:hypothetical protein